MPQLGYVVVFWFTPLCALCVCVCVCVCVQLCGEKKSPTDQGELTGMLKELKYAPEQVFKY